MSEIKENLQDVVQNTMIPEVEAYLEDLMQLLEQQKATEDDMDAIKEMESFLVELQNILLAIDEDKMNEEQATEVYEKIMDLLKESSE
ncbi:MAG: hypothetical protein RBT24_02225 [Arcobacteraceae bacterium]|jgi:hypothetical protein|nr:hypothetical protein [Arcobacteraceae bacterium]